MAGGEADGRLEGSVDDDGRMISSVAARPLCKWL